MMLMSEQLWHALWFRAAMSGVTACVMMLLLGNPAIRLMRRWQMGEVVREHGPKRHLSKAGTPTMGGVLIVLVVVITAMWWCEMGLTLALLLGGLVAYAALGFYDDARKCWHASRRGLSARHKFLCQSLLAFVLAGVFYHAASMPAQTALHWPFWKMAAWPLGAGSIALSWGVVVGTSNAVNLTDGLDGLAIFQVVIVAAGLGALAYVASVPSMAQHWALPRVPGAETVVVFAMALVGAGLGFLWFNRHPAKVFMGDVGSLSLGAVLGVMAMILRQELLLLVMGGIFVAETVSVILQVGSFRLRGGKRIFLMAPLHHHYELKGWSERKVVRRFWLVTFLLVSASLLTLTWR